MARLSMERDEEGTMRSENPGAVVSRALSRLEPLRSVRTDALEVAYFEAGPSVLITSSSTSTRSRRAVTSPRGNSRTSSLPRCERLSDHCASWRERGTAGTTCARLPTPHGATSMSRSTWSHTNLRSHGRNSMTSDALWCRAMLSARTQTTNHRKEL